MIISWLRSLFSFLFARELWIALAVLLLAVLIWGYGPLLALGTWHPLTAAWARVGVIGLLIMALLWRWSWRFGGGSGRRLLEQLRRRREAVPAPPPEVQASELRQRFQQALWTLRDARADSRRWTHWLDRLSGQYVYRLPWYLVVGDTGSGKTALLHQLRGGAPSLEFAGAAGGEHIPRNWNGIWGTVRCWWTRRDDLSKRRRPPTATGSNSISCCAISGRASPSTAWCW